MQIYINFYHVVYKALMALQEIAQRTLNQDLYTKWRKNIIARISPIKGDPEPSTSALQSPPLHLVEHSPIEAF
jgi:hypothetical protein